MGRSHRRGGRLELACGVPSSSEKKTTHSTTSIMAPTALCPCSCPRNQRTEPVLPEGISGMRPVLQSGLQQRRLDRCVTSAIEYRARSPLQCGGRASAPSSGQRPVTLLTNATTTRVLIDKHPAVGVKILKGGATRQIQGKQVILSAGAVHTPKILMHSINPPNPDLKTDKQDVCVGLRSSHRG